VKKGSLEPTALLAELAESDDPATDLRRPLKRLRRAGALTVYVALQGRAEQRGLSADEARAGPAVVRAEARRFAAESSIHWSASARPIRAALADLTRTVDGLGQLARFRFAASDMGLVAHAAEGLVEASDQRSPAHHHDRVIETGMVLTYARPFLPSNEARLGEKWWPEDEAERGLHDELIELPGVYHARATHAPQRRLENVGRGEEGRPLYRELWAHLPVEKLRLLQALAARQAERFAEKANAIEDELFGSLDY
jgi:hypothetical protein